MSLEQLEKKLYKPGGGQELEKEREERSEYDPHIASTIDFGAPPETNWNQLPPSWFSKRKKILIIIGAALILVSGIATGLTLYIRSKGIFDKEKIIISIDGPKTIISGDTIIYSVKYSNNSSVDLNEAELNITPPKDLDNLKLKITFTNGAAQEKEFSKKIKIAKIAQQSAGAVEISGRLVAPEKSIHYFETNLTFKPANISSRFETNAKFSTTVRDIPVQFSLNAPQQVSSGEEISYTFDIANNTENSLSDIEVKWELPEGFIIKENDPNLDKNNITKISSLKPKQEKQIKLNGTLSGDIGEIKVVKVAFGQNQNNEFVKYGEEQSPTKIGSFYLTITQTVNGSIDYKASPGERLNYHLAYKNNTELGIGEIIVKAKLEEKLLDFKSLETNDGSFDATTGTITWRGTDAPGLLVLSPGEQGEIKFSINIKDRLPINNFNDKNFTTKSIAEIESREVPTQLKVNKLFQSNETVIKINSRLTLQAKAYYDEPTASIKNTGHIPPQINKQTTYTIHWRIINLTNDVDGVKLTSSLPPNVQWTNQSSTNNGTNIHYDEGTNQLNWEIGKVPANTGIISPTIEGIFQVALTPPPNQIGSSPDILNPTQISGNDTFTNIGLDDKADALNTEIPDDSKYGGKGEVIE